MIRRTIATFAAGAAVVAAGLATAGCGSCPPAPSGMVCVKKPDSGEFVKGYDKGKPNEKPERKVTMNHHFHLDAFEVTNEQFAKYRREAQKPEWKYPAGADRLPVAGVTYHEAEAYAKHVKKRLPTEEEWEYACRGEKGRLYAWGNEYAPDKANSFEAGRGAPAPLGSYHVGDSVLAEKSKVHDLCGNVWEWTSSAPTGGSTRRITKGGSYAPDEDRPRCSLRADLSADEARENVGFRCAQDP